MAQSLANYTAANTRGSSSNPTQVFGHAASMSQKQGFQNLYEMLLNKGRVDPRLLASIQAQNARSTQQQQDAAMARGSASGFGGGGLNQALQAAIGSAGQNRAANLNYQDINDAYNRNQQNIGLMNETVTNPQLGYTNLFQQNRQFQQGINQQREAAKMALFGSVLGAVGGAAGGCWVAESIFGPDSDNTHLSRVYVNAIAPDNLRSAYMRDGQELAEMVSGSPEMQSILRPVFLEFASVARHTLTLDLEY